jgi:hypothetical protein
MAILRGFLGSKGRVVGVLGLPPQKEMPTILMRPRGHPAQFGLADPIRTWHNVERPPLSQGGDGELIRRHFGLS